MQELIFKNARIFKLVPKRTNAAMSLGIITKDNGTLM